MAGVGQADSGQGDFVARPRLPGGGAEEDMRFRLAMRSAERQSVGGREADSSASQVASQSCLGEPDAVLQPVADQGGDGL